MNDTLVSRVAVILFAIIIAIFGIYHFTDPENLSLDVPSYLPGAHLWVYAVGAFLILAAVSLVLNKMVKLVSYLLALLLVTFAIAIHLKGYLGAADKELASVSFMNMLRDLALAFCLLYIGATTKAMHVVKTGNAPREITENAPREITGAISV